MKTFLDVCAITGGCLIGALLWYLIAPHGSFGQKVERWVAGAGPATTDQDPPPAPEKTVVIYCPGCDSYRREPGPTGSLTAVCCAHGLCEVYIPQPERQA